MLDDAAAYLRDLRQLHGPDVLLVGLDADPQEALCTAKRIGALAPTCGIIVYGCSATMDLLSQAMAAGARRYLSYPFDGPALLKAVGDVYEEMKPLAASNARMALAVAPEPRCAAVAPASGNHEPKVIAVFSPKGGVGTSTLAVNLACALSA